MPDMSVLIATYNRAEVLRQTLEAMCRVDREGLDVEFVIIDNNSKDHTTEVIKPFKDRLPIRHLFQPRQGKSTALNLALDTVELGDIVVFIDDDVVPHRDWLNQVARACKEFPDTGVFGWRIRLIWPDNLDIPQWAFRKDMQWLFNPRDLGNDAYPYAESENPPGANTWVRRALCVSHRFDETRGPGGAYAPGEDSLFVKTLIENGHNAGYVGSAEVGHLVQPRLLTAAEVRRRASKYGRHIALKTGLSRESFFLRHPYLWLAMRLISIVRYWSATCIFSIPLPFEWFFLTAVSAPRSLGLNLAQFRMAWLRLRPPCQSGFLGV